MQRAIDTLNKKFPNINAVPASEFSAEMENGIWFRQEGEAHPDGTSYFNYYRPIEVHPEVEEVLGELGFFPEPYDAGTWFAWKG